MNRLADRRVLVVEDEALIAMDVEALLASEGCLVIGPVSNVLDALLILKKTQKLDGALLDVNLGHEQAFPVADALAAANVPFVLVSGYSALSIPLAHRNRPLVTKPYLDNMLLNTLCDLIEH